MVGLMGERARYRRRVSSRMHGLLGVVRSVWWKLVARLRFWYLGVEVFGELKVTGGLYFAVAPGVRVWIGRNGVWSGLSRTGNGDNSVCAYLPTFIYVYDGA